MSIGLDIQGIILFFIFITPGFLFTRTFLAYRPRYFKTPNNFEQLALSLIGSALIHGTFLGAATLAILSLWLVGQTFNLEMFLFHGIPLNQWPLHIAALYLNTAAFYLLLSLIAARRAGIFLGKKMPGSTSRWWATLVGEDPPEDLLLWHIVLQEEPLKMGILWPRVSLRLRNGDQVEGRLNRMKLVGDEDNTIELALTNASYRPAHTDTLTPLQNQTLLIQSKDILWLARADTP